MRKDSLVFLTRFFIVFILVYCFFLWIDLSVVQNIFAGWQFSMLSLLGVNAGLGGNVVSLPAGNFIIDASCIGIVSTAMLFGLVSASPKLQFGNKLKVVFVGLIGLLSLNLYRVLGVLLIGDWFGLRAAEIVHISTWFLMAFAVAGVWYFSVMFFERPVEFTDVL